MRKSHVKIVYIIVKRKDETISRWADRLKDTKDNRVLGNGYRVLGEE